MSRHIALIQEAGVLRAKGFEADEIFIKLMAHPDRNGLPETELRRMADDMGNKPAGERRDYKRSGDPVADLAGIRGHSPSAYMSLGAVADGAEARFPMRGADGGITGWRRRKGDNGTFTFDGEEKKAITSKGGKAGLIMPLPFPVEGVALFVEGEMDAGAAISAGYAATVATPGALPGNRVIEYAQKVLAGRDVVLAPDPDDAGNKWRDKFSRALMAAGCRVSVIPGLPGKDLDKRLQHVKCDDRAAELQRLIAEAIPVAVKSTTRKDARGEGLPEIEIGTDEHRVNDEVVAAISAVPGLYQRGAALVEIGRDVKLGEIKRATGSPSIQVVSLAKFREITTKACQFMAWRQNRKTEEMELVPAHPPAWCTQAVIARRFWPNIPPLINLLRAPFLRSDGSICDAPGYDAATGNYLDFDAKDLRVEVFPMAEDVEASADLLRETFTDLPFQSPPHEAACIAALLTPLARTAFDASCPINAFDGSAPASGKTLSADVIGIVITGAGMPRTTYPGDDDEMRKRITASALAGDQLVLIDNIFGAFGCPALDAALTAPTWKDRILGQSENTPELPLRMTWYASGNNIAFAGDISRRVNYIRLNPRMEDPEQRTGFRHPQLRVWARDNRGRILSAALTILRAYCVAGKPDQHLSALGSFEEWSDLVRGAVVWAGFADPCEGRIELKRTSDRNLNALRVLVENWESVDPTGTGISVAELIRCIETGGEQYDAIRTAVYELLPASTGKLNPKSVGMKLHHLKDKIVSGLCLNRRDGRNGAIWTVEDCGTKGTKGTKTDASRAHAGAHAHAPEQDDWVGNSAVSPASPTDEDLYAGVLNELPDDFGNR